MIRMTLGNQKIIGSGNYKIGNRKLSDQISGMSCKRESLQWPESIKLEIGEIYELKVGDEPGLFKCVEIGDNVVFDIIKE
jgi:hypothetical protein